MIVLNLAQENQSFGSLLSCEWKTVLVKLLKQCTKAEYIIQFWDHLTLYLLIILQLWQGGRLAC
jgi:hypothetical protein